MSDAILQFAHELMSSWWIYLALWGFAALDGFFPAIPSETLVVTAGVFAAAGEPNLYAVIVVAAVGAFMGDHISYALGRGAGGRMLDRMTPGTRRYAAVLWARQALAERGGLVLVVARYVPGGRTAVTLTMGSVRYPLRQFSGFAALAAVSWGIYCSLVGYIGGKAFEDNPLKGVVLGIGLALAVTLVVEVVRHRLKKRREGQVEAELVEVGRR
ncbi:MULTISPECIES: DedA family protein [Kribbella]|jgi:membrane protein DedA with SNARE-associated domain|uniref:Membrane protein DedA with SNARE-associated domain n=1 Tax=Kribbella pratensis TaxID=2512112 RepID=A0ABY2FK41_9ACTN|nr:MULTISPECIES: DedA family protein [Kribbella]TDW86447.1 membrane protein DedA with SNARE-associated domain [Kribbella sp. VKM Ac-2566]TDW93495.1 membrane protein DedA with SNARE-associated domain [Kribbella pratensis]